MTDRPDSTRYSLQSHAFALLQHVLPQHAISRAVHALTRVRSPWLKNRLIRGFLRLYPVDMRDAAVVDALAYSSFNEFFTRALHANARPIVRDESAVASPVDGTVSECGRIETRQLLQAKGKSYSLDALLADSADARQFEHGTFCTIYLAPFNYHRIHMPLRGTLRATRYVPGRLFSVNAATSRHVPRLFTRNERVVCIFDTVAGPMAVVLVGALNVGSIATVWAGDITPARMRQASVLAQRVPDPNLTLDKGDELGRFNMGSTVIVLFAQERVQLVPSLRAGAVLRLGEEIARLEPPPIPA